MKRLAFYGLAVLALATGFDANGQTNSRPVRCQIEFGGKLHVNGQCRFTPDTGGSFALENTDRNKPLFDEILIVSVAIVSPGVAEVRGLTKSGINSRWGEARRSTRDRACWEGADFRICAY